MLYGEALRYSSFPEYIQEFNTSVTIRLVKKKEERVLVGAKNLESSMAATWCYTSISSTRENDITCNNSKSSDWKTN